MRAGECDFYIEQGVDWSRMLTFYNKDGSRSNLSGDSFAMQIKETAQTQSVIAAPIITVLTPPSQGQILLSFTAAQTSAIPAHGQDWSKLAKYTYTLIRIRSDGRKARLLNGTIYISPEVTKYE